MKKICVKEANEVEIQFRDKTFVATFNMRAVMFMQEELNKIGLERISFVHFAAIVLYAGIRANNEDYTMDEAKALAMTISPADLNSIVEEYVQSVNGVSVAENEEQLKKVIAQMLGKGNTQ